jgi:hypothetical protein
MISISVLVKTEPRLQVDSPSQFQALAVQDCDEAAGEAACRFVGASSGDATVLISPVDVVALANGAADRLLTLGFAADASAASFPCAEYADDRFAIEVLT